MSLENKNLRKMKMLKKKNRPDEIDGASNFDFDSTQQETLGKRKTRKNKEKSELDSKKKRKRDKSTESKEELGIMMEERKTLDKTMIKAKKGELGLKKKKKEGSGVDSNDVDGVDHEDLDGEHKGPAKEKKSKLALKKKRRREIENDVDASNDDQIQTDEHAAGDRPKSYHAKSSTKFKTLKESVNSEKPKKASNGTKIKTKKAKKEMKRKKKVSVANERKIEQTLDFFDEGNVEEISSVDEDCSRGMRKWLIKYKESRPGLNILQERIDDFITAYEEQQEQERKEREARAAEGGWTVVVHHKGRKKTTEAETCVTVGSVAQAAVVDKMGKKKNKDVPLDFYRFKKREAQRNEIMMQQNKFEQDKKRIQQLRSARKFRPY